MAIDTWFPLAIARETLLPPDDLLACMQQHILDWRGDVFANPSGESAWTGDVNGVAAIHAHPDFAWLRQQVEAQVLGFCQQLGFDTDALELMIQRAWPIVSEPGQSIGAHHHPNAHLSVVYYLSGDGDPDAGCLRIFDERPRNELVPGMSVGYGDVLEVDNPYNRGWVDYAPHAGLMLIFPSSTRHGVTENCSDGLRLSVSFDIHISARAAQGPAPEYLAPPVTSWSAFSR